MGFCTVPTVPTPLAGARKSAVLGASIWSLARLISYAAATTILIVALGFLARESGLPSHIKSDCDLECTFTCTIGDNMKAVKQLVDISEESVGRESV